MARSNFLKVEGYLTEGLHKISVNRLLDLADAASGIGTSNEEYSPKRLCTLVERELKWIYQQDPQVFKALNIEKKRVKQLFDNPKDLSHEEIEFLKKLKADLKKYKQEKFTKSDEELVNDEKKRHINKRFNVNEKWLPLS